MILNHPELIERGFDNLPWVEWTPTISSGVGSYGSVTVKEARYRKLGKIVQYHLHIILTTIGTASGFVFASKPPGLTISLSNQGSGREIARTGTMLSCEVSNTSGFIISTYDFGVPATVDGDTVVVSGFFLAEE